MVKTLLAVEKCNTSLQDNMGRTPLHWAAVLGIKPALSNVIILTSFTYYIV